MYYQADPGHRRTPDLMCFDCHVQGAGLNGSSPRWKRGKQRPTLTVDTLEAFWREDVSDDDYVLAAARFFWVERAVIEALAVEIEV